MFQIFFNNKYTIIIISFTFRPKESKKYPRIPFSKFFLSNILE